MSSPADIISALIGVAALTLMATLALAVFRVPRLWTAALAIVRGALQLAVISVILTGIISSPDWIAVALLVMFSVAVAVATSRIGWSLRAATTMATSIAIGVVASLAIIFASGAVEFTARYALAISAIIIGNTMSIATLTGRMFTSGLVDHWEEVEGWLALGATPRAATNALARRAVRDALIPSIDQTKTTGLVVLPGAFIGAIFGGLSPIEAGRFQIVVLAGILAAGSLTAVSVARWMGDVRTKPSRLT